MRLYRDFDFADVDGTINLSYWIWYDIERDYDYLYLNVFEGNEWLNLTSTSCTETNPTGSNFGCGYNGQSAGWVQETVDLSNYVGKNITLEFEYITDAAVNGEGLVLYDIEIQANSYLTGFEDETHGWEADGFVRIENMLPKFSPQL